ncbi:hypothetical protein AN958_06621 [Leucoagaricus sp. SymC.cos]|nr:hypothetical protein AN958_06621 [Leucoagaricus sp. SymC.cos]
MAQVDFPYGKKRGWEFDTADADIGLKSVPDSLVLQHSLPRERWLSHTFPKFSSKARGAKAPEPPPPHTIMARGKCELVVGAHRFRQTTFYEVHYMQPASAVPMTYQTTTPYSAYSANSAPTATAVPSTAAPPTAASGSPENEDLSQLRLTLGGGLEYTISSDLVARIHHEASVNPIFANKFRLAVDPNATPEQIRNFAFALPHLPGVKVTGASTSLTLSTSEPPVRLPPVREWDLVIEFHETPNERLLIPRGTLASCSRLVSKDSSSLPEVSLTLRLPVPDPQSKSTNPDDTNADKSTSDTNPPRSVKFTLRQTPNAVYDLILNWIGGNDKNRENAAALAKGPKRQKVYLPHRIAQGALLTQLQAAQTPGYTLKPMKQAPSAPPRPRRKAAPKPKPTPQETPGSATPTEVINGSTTPSIPPQKPAKPPKEPKEPKRRRYQTTVKPTPVIRCTVCFKTDVPLMKGGRFCRECVDAGKADDNIPQLPTKVSQSSYRSTPYPFISTPTVTTPAAVSPPSIQSQPAQNTSGATSTATTPSVPSAVPGPSPTPNSVTPSQDTPAAAAAVAEITSNT